MNKEQVEALGNRLIRSKDGTQVRCEVYAAGKNGAEVIFYAVEGGRHTWPGGRQYLPERIIGKTSKETDANKVIWNFFKKHSKKIASAKPFVKRIKTFRIKTIKENGGRVDWSHKLNLIAFDKKGKDIYYDIYIMNPDGSGERCLTCRKPGVPHKHNGNPAWHPSGKYLVFQAQDPNLKLFPRQGRIGYYITSPGIGINNNLWLMTADGTQFWQLTHVLDRHGTLHPHFAPDGKRLLWSEIISPRFGIIGRWAIKLASFSIENSQPRLVNIKTLRPKGLQLYEVHGFSPDGQTIIFSGIEEGKYYYDMEIYTMDLATGRLTQLTDNDEWDEHAHFTPDGSRIVSLYELWT